MCSGTGSYNDDLNALSAAFFAKRKSSPVTDARRSARLMRDTEIFEGLDGFFHHG